MIISKTPYRVSFFGGGTDYPAWYGSEGGAVLSTTIDKYCYISCRNLPPFFQERHRIVWSHIETVSSFDEILHPAVREGLKYLGFDPKNGLEITHQGDLPARSGMGSSSSFVVGLINVLSRLRSETLSKQELAKMAIELEQVVLEENVGSQDQIAASFGGFNRINFEADGSYSVKPVQAEKETLALLEDNLLLFYTGTTRFASTIAKDVIANFEVKKDYLREIHAMVDIAESILQKGPTGLDDFGLLLHETWMKKRLLAEGVSSTEIDRHYQTAMDAGAIGGKLLGAGGAGFMLFYVPKQKQQNVVKALSMSCLHVPFNFENEGSTVMVKFFCRDFKPLFLCFLPFQPVLYIQ